MRVGVEMINKEDHDSKLCKPEAKKTSHKPYPESHVPGGAETTKNLPGVRKGNEAHTAHPDTE